VKARDRGVIAVYRKANQTLESLATLHRYPRDLGGNRYHVFGYAVGTRDGPPLAPQSAAIALIGGWINHALFHRGEWEIRFRDIPSEGSVDIDPLGPLLAKHYRNAREVAAALDAIETAIRTTRPRPPPS
jgi:hypothetical protein